jgi:hypothetical protein
MPFSGSLCSVHQFVERRLGEPGAAYLACWAGAACGYASFRPHPAGHDAEAVREISFSLSKTFADAAYA